MGGTWSVEYPLEGVKNIVFDLGDVVINISPERCFDAFAKLFSMQREQVVLEFDKLQVFEKYESGKISDVEFLSLIRTISIGQVSDEEIIHAWQQILLDIPKERIDLIQELASDHKIYVLSNTSHYHMIEVNAILERVSGVTTIDELVEKTYYSYEMGLRKPDPEIYSTLLRDSNLTPNETLFLDDNRNNVEAAIDLGIRAILVEKPKDICSYLNSAIGK